MSGVSTYLTLTDQFFSAVGSLTEVKRQFINSFSSGSGGQDFLLRAQGGGIGQSYSNTPGWTNHSLDYLRFWSCVVEARLNLLKGRSHPIFWGPFTDSKKNLFKSILKPIFKMFKAKTSR
jgi:hypothetical protein